MSGGEGKILSALSDALRERCWAHRQYANGEGRCCNFAVSDLGLCGSCYAEIVGQQRDEEPSGVELGN